MLDEKVAMVKTAEMPKSEGTNGANAVAAEQQAGGGVFAKKKVANKVAKAAAKVKNSQHY